MQTRIVYAVKFPCGYYAKKQPNYEWSFTDDVGVANLYLSEKAAKERGQLGVDLYEQYTVWQKKTLTENYGTFVIECYTEVTELKLKETT